jgi:glycosyltransferase involved in cell wall biosynthesis
MLRIVHVTGLISSKYGALERFWVSLAAESTARGHQFHCLMEAPPYSRQFADDLEAAGGRAVVMPARKRPLAFGVELMRWLRQQGINVLHAHFTPASTLSLMAGYLVGVPVRVSHIHTGFSGWGQDLPQNISLRMRTSCRLRRSLATRTLVVSRGTLEQYRLAEGGGRESKVFYLGVDVSDRPAHREAVRQTLDLAPNDPVLICVAFHAPIKGVDVLIDALGLLREQHPRLKLIQVGGSPDPADASPTEALKRQAERAGVADRILWLGFRNDVPDLLRCADIYCQPSRSEALGLAILEAMTAGLPVVASRVGGVPEAVEDGRTGLLVAPESPQALAAAIASLLVDEEKRRGMGAEGRTLVRQRFDVNRQSRLLLDLYEGMWQRLSLP